MGKYSEADIDAMLKQIRDTVDKQSVDNTPESENSKKNASPDELINKPDELINKIKANISDDVTLSSENEEDKDNYDISGFEIEEEIEPVYEIEDKLEIHEPCEETVELVEEAVELVEETVDDISEESFVDMQATVDAIEEAPEFEPLELFDELSASEATENEEEKSDNLDDEQLVAEVDDALTEDIEEVVDEVIEEPVEEVAEEAAEEIVEEAVAETVDEIVDETTELEEVVSPTIEASAPMGDAYEKITSVFKTKSDDGNAAAFDLAHKHELDESDINVAISLGSKEALEDSIGFVKVREARSNFIDPTVKKNLSSFVFDYKNNEYKGDNLAQIKGGYRKGKKRIARRLVFSSIIFFLTAFLEVVYYSSLRVPYVSDVLDIPYAFGIVVSVLLLGAILFSVRKIVYGLMGFVSTRPNYYTTTGMIVFANLLYSIIVIVAFSNEGIFLFNSVVILALVLDIIGEYMHISREILTFELVSDSRPKLSLERHERTIETVKKETYLSKREFYIENTSFVGKYFERTAKLPSFYYVDYIYNVIFSMISIIASVAIMVYIKNLSYGVLSFNLLLTVSIPLQREFLTALPIYMVSRSLSKQDSAIIGESVIDEYVGKNTIYLDDVEIFGRHGVKVVNLKTYNNFNVVDINYYYLSIFSQISGPLKNAFGDESRKIKISDNTKLVNVYDGGIEALIDGTNRVFVGNHSFFETHNLVSKLPEERKSVNDELVTMYMSANGALCAEFQFKYIIDKHFEAFADDMASSGAEVGVRTIDPNINEDMIKRIRRTGSYMIRVTRPTLNDIVPIGRRSDSGIITCKNHHMIPRILDLCLEIKKIKRTQTFVWLIYSIVSVVSIALMAFFGVLKHISPFYIIGYQMLWSFGIVLFVVNKLKNRK